jgi:hypothetical protein
MSRFRIFDRLVPELSATYGTPTGSMRRVYDVYELVDGQPVLRRTCSNMTDAAQEIADLKLPRYGA